MAVGRGSILRAAGVANGAEQVSQTTETKKVNIVEIDSIHEEKIPVITSLKEELPIHLL